jgi:hypothetical protein
MLRTCACADPFRRFFVAKYSRFVHLARLLRVDLRPAQRALFDQAAQLVEQVKGFFRRQLVGIDLFERCDGGVLG